MILFDNNNSNNDNKVIRCSLLEKLTLTII